MSMLVNIKITAGKLAPRYTDPKMKEIKLDHVNITEKGTKSDLPIIDLVMEGTDGNKYLLVLTGRVITSIGKAIEGINYRNHGNTDP